MRKNATQFYFTRVPFLSTTVVCHYTFSCGVVLRRTPASSGASSRTRSGYLPRLCRNCKHFYPTLHHLLITCPSNFLKGARKTLRDAWFTWCDFLYAPLSAPGSSTWIFGQDRFPTTWLGHARLRGTLRAPIIDHWTLRNGHTLWAGCSASTMQYTWIIAPHFGAFPSRRSLTVSSKVLLRITLCPTWMTHQMTQTTNPCED